MDLEHVPKDAELPGGWEWSIGESGEGYYFLPAKFYVDVHSSEFRSFTLVMDTIGTDENIKHSVALSTELHHKGDVEEEWIFSSHAFKDPEKAGEKAIDLMQEVLDGEHDGKLFELYCEDFGHEVIWEDATVFNNQIELTGTCEHCKEAVDGWVENDDVEVIE